MTECPHNLDDQCTYEGSCMHRSDDGKCNPDIMKDDPNFPYWVHSYRTRIPRDIIRVSGEPR